MPERADETPNDRIRRALDTPLPPHLLWQQADREYQRGDVEDRRVRYVELMVEAGHIIPKEKR